MKQLFKYICCSIAFLFVGIIGTILVLNNYPILEKNNEKNTKVVSVLEKNTIKTSIEKVKDAVVVVETYDDNNNAVGTGTGFIYKIDDKFGYIITNNHVVENSKKITITNNNEEEVSAKLLGNDEYSDIAVLSIDKKLALSKISFGESTNSDIGDTVFTVGSPLGKKYLGTVTKGILSGKDRQVEVNLTNGSFIMEVLQTDAAINPGNSGGPLLNINGEVIGVTSMKLVQDEIEGMGFAIPIELVTPILEDLENGKEIERPYFGVQLLDVDKVSYFSRYYNINVDSNIKNGTIIMKLEDNSLAKNVGLKVGDVIVKVDNEKVENTAHFRYLLYKYHVGDKMKITYNRNGNEKTIEVKLSKKL